LADARNDGGSLLKVQPDFSGEPPRLLVVSNDQWWTRSISSILKRFPFELITAEATEQAIQLVAIARPEAAIIHVRVREDDGFQLVTDLRREGLGAENAIILLPDHPLTREQRLAALRAGVWDCMGPPISGEELVLKLQSYLGASRVAAAARQHALLDETSGLYNLHGILRWARELSNAAKRHGRPFGCAVFAPVEEPASDLDQAGIRTWEESSREIALRLTSRGRSSDIVGRLSPREYIVLAPDADPNGIMEMATRFVTEGASGSSSSIHLRAGCSAVSNLAVESIEPAELIARATFALRRLRGPDAGPVEFFAGSRGIN
jgi:PleD family two-component response regulator